jgi:DedD protein
VGGLLALIGCLSMLGLAFGLGVLAGRYWSRSAVGPTVAAATEERSLRGGRASVTTPPLTFYQELTAPLAPTPVPPPRTAAEPRRLPEKNGLAAASDDPARRREGDAASRTVVDPVPRGGGPAAGAGAKYTVQIGAYGTREPAEALREALVAAGHEAYVVEMDGRRGAARYRVRIGSFPTRVAAAAAAARLERGGYPSTYVTSR